MRKAEMIMRGSTALESANALFRRAQAPANAERLCSNIWDGVTATRSTRRWLHRGRAFAVAPSSFALDIPHVAFSTGEGIANEKLKALYLFPARAHAHAHAQAWRGGGRRAVRRRVAARVAARGGAWRRVAARGRRLAVFAYRRHLDLEAPHCGHGMRLLVSPAQLLADQIGATNKGGACLFPSVLPLRRKRSTY